MDIYSKVDLRLQISDTLRNTALQNLKPGSGTKLAINEFDNLEQGRILNDSTIGKLLETLGVQDNPENRGMAVLALLHGFTLNEKTINFFIGKKFKTSFFYKTLIEKCLEAGYTHEVEELKDSFPRLETLANFLKNFEKSIGTIKSQTLKLCNLLLKYKNSRNLKNFLGDLYSGMLLELNDNLPFHNMQIPLTIKDNIYPSEAWLAKEKDIVYLELVLPNLKTIGCLLEDWRTYLTVTFYCQKEFEKIIENRLALIREILGGLGFKCKSMTILNMARENGLLHFLSHFERYHKMIDISI